MTIRMAKFTLTLEEDYPFIVLGINSTAPNYRLCWHLNKALEIALKREHPIDIHSKYGNVTAHNVFTFFDEDINLKYRFIENKRGSSLFLPEVPKADYLLVLDETDMISIQEVLSELNKIALVILAFKIDMNSLKQKQNLMLTA